MQVLECTIGLRVSVEEEILGADVTKHHIGTMYHEDHMPKPSVNKII